MRFWDSPKTTIAAVHKYCLASGMELAVACDITIAAEGCRFGVPEVKFGSGIVALILPWVAGPRATSSTRPSPWRAPSPRTTGSRWT